MTIAINPSPLNGQSQLRLTPRGRALARLAVVSSLSILLLAGFSLFSWFFAIFGRFCWVL
ncbi:MAG: hypothetical protein RLZZ92_855 [Actinomycetota bacterium]